MSEIVARHNNGAPITYEDAVQSLKDQLNQAASAVIISGARYQPGDIVEALDPDVFQRYVRNHILAMIDAGKWKRLEN